MTGETERSPSGWTTDTVKVLEDEKIQALERLFQAEIKRLEAVILGQERAVSLLGNANQIAQDKFEATVRDGFVKQNEFRGSLDDLGKQMATRRELEAALGQLAELRSRLDVGPIGLAAVANQQATQLGRQQGFQLIAANPLLAAILVVAAGLLGHYLK